MKRIGPRSSHGLWSRALWLSAAVVVSGASCAESTVLGELCSAPSTECDGICVDPATDGANCGACGNACSDDEVCLAGECGEGEGGAGGAGGGGGAGGVGGVGGCGEGLTDCGNTCADIQTDPFHCGSCEIACPIGRVCAGGACQGCSTGLTLCGGDCADLRNNPQHCGSCTRVCDPGSPCVSGVCGCSTDSAVPLAPTIPQTVTGTTVGQPDAHSLSCSPSGAADATYLFTAPTTGTFLFDTFGSGFNTVLGGLTANSCAELTCNDNADVGYQSQVSLDLGEGEAVLVVVSGAAGAQGNFILNVGQPGPVMCTPLALDPIVPQTVTGTTAGRGDSVVTACNFGSSGDVTYTFTAPAAGRYVFDPSASPMEAVVDVLNGDTCTAFSLGCGGGFFGARQAVVDLAAGQTVLLAVEGFGSSSGPYSLTFALAPPCPANDLGSTAPQTATGTNAGLVDLHMPSCAVADGGAEVTYSFTAPADDLYVFDTFGSSYNTVLELLDGSCSGPALECNDDASGTSSQVSALLTAGQTVVVVIDSYGEVGDYVLNVTEVPAPPCPMLDLGSTAPQTVTGNNTGYVDLITPSCAFGGGSGEATYSFTAPNDNMYVFDTFGSSFNTVLDVLDGSCFGASLECSDDVSGTDSQVSVLLSAGQTVLVLVDGYGEFGDYVLNVTEVPAPPCPMLDLGSTVPQTVTGNNAGYVDVLTPACGNGSGGEATYRFTAVADGYYDFNTSGSTLPVVLSLRDGACSGPEFACSNAADTGSARLIVPLVAGQTVIVSVDSNGDVDDYVFDVSLFSGEGSCASPTPLDPVVPQTVSGNTSGYLAVIEGSCGASTGPDVVYSFTAPANGTYSFDTSGSAYDTVLHLHEGACAGAELACNDDSGGTLASQVSATLTAGQSVVLVVDGSGGAFGPFTLHIN